MTNIPGAPAMDPPDPEFDAGWQAAHRDYCACGEPDATLCPDLESAEIQAEIEAERDAPEWDDAASAAYHARGRAGRVPGRGHRA
jgi:hypothetical protein